MNFTKPLLLVLTASALTSAATAQDVMISAEKPFRAALGIFTPVAGSTREAMGSTLPLLSLSYDVSKSLAEKPMIYGIFFDYAQNRKQGTNTSMAAFGVSARIVSRSPLSRSNYYAGAGVGSYSVKLGESNSKIGGKLFLGYERTSGYFGEATYHLINKVHGNDPSGLGLVIGRRY